MSAVAVAVAVTMRPVTAGDSPVLREVFVASRPWLQLLSLPLQLVTTLVDQQWRAQTVGHAAAFPHASDQVLLLDGMPVGRLLADHGPDVTTVVDLAVMPVARGRGVATAALRALLEDTDRRAVDVRLTVTAGNPAARIYRRLGFVVTGHHGPDDVMTRPAGVDRQEVGA